MKERGYIQLDESIYFKWFVFIRLISETYDYVTITNNIYEKDKNNVIIITPSDLSYVISKIRVDEVPNINFTFNRLIYFAYKIRLLLVFFQRSLAVYQ